MPGNAGADNIKGRRFNVYRNGDSMFRPVQWTYSNRYFKSWDKLCEDLQEKVPQRTNQYGQGGVGIKVLYSEDGKTKMKTLEEIEKYEGENLVAAGPEPFKNVQGGYKSIPPRTPVPPREEKGKEKEDESYREKNKKRYGEVQRSEDQKIHNRTDAGATKRFTVYRNGDEKFKPKLYIWRSKQTQTWEKLLEDLKRVVPTQTGGPVQHIYTLDGKKEIDDFEDIEENGHYVVAGEEYAEVYGGYEEAGSKERENAGKETDPEKRDEDFWERDRETLRKHREKMGGQRKEEEKLYNRKDQYQPEPMFIFAFRNGAGMEAQRYIFSPKQLDRGMPWLLEQIAKKFFVNPKRLVTMDGQAVPTVGHLENRGCYVVVPLGEKFRDTWYYLPEGAVDTSEDADEEENDRQRVNSMRSPNPYGRDRSQNNRNNNQPDENRNRSRSRSQDSRTESDRDDRKYDDDDESHYEEESNYSRGRSRERSRTRSPREHDHSNDSQCSFCEMLEEQRAKHERKYHTPTPSPRGRADTADSNRSDDRQQRGRGREDSSETDQRNQRNRQNSRSISPANRKPQNRGPQNFGPSYRSNSTNMRQKQSNELTPNYNKGPQNRTRPRTAQSNGSNVIKMTRSNSEASVFHAKSRQSSGRPSTVNYDRDDSGKYRAQSGRVETRGAKEIKETKRTKTELPIDRQKAREVPEEKPTRNNSNSRGPPKSGKSGTTQRSVVSNYRR